MTNPPPVRNSRFYTTIAAAIIIAAVVISAAIITSSALYTTVTKTTTTTTTVTQTSSSAASTSSCNYVLPGPCPTGGNFTLSVNYNGPWKLTYQGYNSLCYTTCSNGVGNSNLPTVSGSYNGTGIDSRNITVKGSNNGWTLCAQAQKLDASSSSLILKITGQNETSIPFGITSTCSEMQIA